MFVAVPVIVMSSDFVIIRDQCAIKTVLVVESPLHWQVAFVPVSQVPFTDDGCEVSCFLERIRKGALVGQHAGDVIAVRTLFHAIAKRIPPCEKGRTGRRTNGMNIKLREADTFTGESIQIRRGNRAADKTGMMPVHVVGEYNQDVGWLFKRGLGERETR